MAYKFHPLVPAKDCSGKAQPGTRALMLASLDNFEGTYDWGIYNCRSVRGGATLSHHAEGRAGDIGIPLVNGRANTKVGDPIVKVLLENAWELGLDHLIWNKQKWSAKYPDGAPYSGSTPTLRHEDHIHAGMTWAYALDLTVDEAYAILEGDNAMAFNAHQEHQLKMLVGALDAVNSDGSFPRYIVPDIRKGIITVDELNEAIQEAKPGETVDEFARRLAKKANDRLDAIKGAI